MNMKSEMSASSARKLLPAWPVSLVSVGDNIITISLYHLVSLDPLMVGIGVHPKRHTHALLKELGNFCLNIPTKGMAEVVNGCGSVSGREVNKYERFGLTPEPGAEIKSKTIAECPLSIECRVAEVVHPSGGSHDWFIGEIVHARCEEGYNPENALLYWGGKYRSIGGVQFEK